MAKVLGIDIGAKFVVSFYLEAFPVGISCEDYFRKNAKSSIKKIRIDNKSEESTVKLQDAIDLLREIQPDAIVMEPTGVWYSKLWAKIAQNLCIEVKWIGHGDLAGQRKAYGFKDKDDRKDAFCLALTYFDPVFNASNRWLTWKTGEIARVNDRLLEIKSLESTTKILTQQLRQRLKYEFPEIADRKMSDYRTKDGFIPWVGYLAGIHAYPRIENERAKSIATELGIEIASYTRQHAAAICRNHIEETVLEADLREALLDPAFDRYRPTLKLFGFGDIMQASLLPCIFPFEKFLLDGQPHIERWEDDRGWHKRNKSLAAFQISLGMGKQLIESGGSTSLIYSGSSLARRQLYTWIMGHVLPEKMADSWLVQELDRRAYNNRKAADTVADLRVRWQSTNGSNKDRHMAGVRSAMTIGYRITRLLYDRLLSEFLG